MTARYSGSAPGARSLPGGFTGTSAALTPRPTSFHRVLLEQQRFLAAHLAKQVDAAGIVERGAQPRELDCFLLVRVRRENLPQRAQIADPARVVLRLDLEFEQLDLDLGVVAVK